MQMQINTLNVIYFFYYHNSNSGLTYFGSAKNSQCILSGECEMEYDPLKNRLARAIDMFPALRKLFYMAFNLIFLRQRYVLKSSQFVRETDKINLYDAELAFVNIPLMFYRIGSIPMLLLQT